jgi:hypothetical protein
MGTSDQVTDWIIFGLVALARLLLPLTIPRWPLIGIVASLILDGVDQTLFQTFTTLDLKGYQGYDKALDIYYLTIAYVSTMRNWSNQFAFQASRFLFYWRLVGVALFELTQIRALLMVFPNTFEYFFIYYEVVALRWDPKRLTKKHVIAAAAAIWIVIKLPQEWWIHIAQLDTTDFLKETVFRVPLDTAWSDILAANPLIFIGSLLLIVAFVAGIWWLVKNKLPPADWSPALYADARQPAFTSEQVRTALAQEARSIVDAALVEKVALVSLVSLIFAQTLPGASTTSLGLVVPIALVVIANTALSHWLARQGYGWAFSLRQFVALGVVNAGLALVYILVRTLFGNPVSAANVFFLALLLTLLVTLYDRYRQVYLMRFES